jgi:hypothetical protein
MFLFHEQGNVHLGIPRSNARDAGFYAEEDRVSMPL